jgi:molybdate transport system ATP-binding protein
MSVVAAYQITRDDFALNVDIEIPTRGITGLFGRSGSGKTTLLRCIAGLERPATGKLVVDGEVWQDTVDGIDKRIHERRIGYVFQEPRLFGHLDVKRNLDYGRQRTRGQAGVVFDEVVALLGIERLLNRRPAQLSGGEAQRVAIARALLRDPRLVLMDEPLAALDRERRDEILPFLDRLHAELSIPIVYVSHSMEETCRLCDHLVVLQDGLVVADGDIQSLLVRHDIGPLSNDESGSIIEGVIESFDDVDCITVVRNGASIFYVSGRVGHTNDTVRLRIKASDVSLCRQEPAGSTILNILPAVVIDVHMSGEAQALVKLAVDKDVILARVSRRSLRQLDIQAGQQLYCQIKAVSVRAAAAVDPDAAR